MKAAAARRTWIVSLVLLSLAPGGTAWPLDQPSPQGWPALPWAFSATDPLTAAAVALDIRTSGGPAPAAGLEGWVPAHLEDVSTARALGAIARRPDEPLARGIALALEANAAQSRVFGRPWTDSPARPHHASPAAALEALMQRHGVAPGPGQEGAMAALDALPEPVRGAFTRLVDAFLAVDAASVEAFRHARSDQLGETLRESSGADDATVGWAPSVGGPAGVLAQLGIDPAPIFPARHELLGAVLGFQRAVAAAGPGLPPVTMQVPPAFALDFAGMDSVWDRSVFFLLDVGGNDLYRNNAGGSNVILGATPVGGAGSALLVDLGGNDQYGDDASRPPGCRGVNGGGFRGGAGFLVDAAGDNRYLGCSSSSNGGGSGGFGFLLDAGRNTTYMTKDGFGANGGANVGGGMLIDVRGNDAYQVLRQWPWEDPYTRGINGGNGGGDLGSGFLLDVEGDDLYDAGSAGANGGGHAVGRGFLLDLAGDDVYVSSSQGANGGGNLGGIGFLADLAGDDRYELHAPNVTRPFCVWPEGSHVYTPGCGANGGGDAGGSGLLLDFDGNDGYRGDGSSGVNGGGDRGGAGLLLDAAGDDVFLAGSGGTNGGGIRGGAGRLLDLRGDDTYVAGGHGSNGGATGSLWCLGGTLPCLPVPLGAGLLLDGGGKDAYEDADSPSGTGMDRTVLPKGMVGAQLDIEATPGLGGSVAFRGSSDAPPPANPSLGGPS